MKRTVMTAILALSAIFAISALTQAQDRSHLREIDFLGPQFTTEFFDVAYTVEPERLELGIAAWDSGGSGATRGAYLARPFIGITKDGPFSWEKLNSNQIKKSDYLLLGDYGFADTDETDNFVEKGIKTRHTSIALRVKPEYLDQNLLAPPVRFEPFWTDKGSGGDKDVTIFRMIPPEGYVALGMVYNDGTEQVNRFRCVKRTAEYTNKEGVKETKSLVKEIRYLSEDKDKPVGFWDDRGSGAIADVALYKVAAAKSSGEPIPKSSMLLVPNVFFASDNYEKFPTDTPYALTLFAEDSGVLSAPETEPKLPTLTSHGEPPESDELVNKFELPYYKVQDSRYPSAVAQAMLNPTYYVKRTSRYVPAVETRSVADDTKLTWSVEKSNTAAKSWNKADSVEVSASVMIGAEADAAFLGVGGKASIEVTAGVAYTGTNEWGGEESTGTAKAGSMEISVKNGQTAVIYEVIHEYEYKRGDGTIVEQYTTKEPDHRIAFSSAFYPQNIIKTEEDGRQFYVKASGPGNLFMAYSNLLIGNDTAPVVLAPSKKIGEEDDQFTKIKVARVRGENNCDAFEVLNFPTPDLNKQWLAVVDGDGLSVSPSPKLHELGRFMMGDYTNDNGQLLFKSVPKNSAQSSTKFQPKWLTHIAGDGKQVKALEEGDDGVAQRHRGTKWQLMLVKEQSK